MNYRLHPVGVFFATHIKLLNRSVQPTGEIFTVLQAFSCDEAVVPRLLIAMPLPFKHFHVSFSKCTGTEGGVQHVLSPAWKTGMYVCLMHQLSL